MLAERAPHLLNSVEESLSFLNGRSVGIDIDAVTQATYILALRKVSKTFGKVISKDHLKTYWELVNIVQKNGISADEALGYAKGAWNNEEVFGNAPEIAEGVSGRKGPLGLAVGRSHHHRLGAARPQFHVRSARETGGDASLPEVIDREHR